MGIKFRRLWTALTADTPRKMVAEYFYPIFSGFSIAGTLLAIQKLRGTVPKDGGALHRFYEHAGNVDFHILFLGLVLLLVSMTLTGWPSLGWLRKATVDPAVKFGHHASLLGAGALLFQFAVDWLAQRPSYAIYEAWPLLAFGFELQIVPWWLDKEVTRRAETDKRVARAANAFGVIALIVAWHWIGIVLPQ